MAHQTGHSGQVMITAGAIAGIKSWTLDYTMSTVETTDFADAGVSTFTPVKTAWSGTFEGYKDTVPVAIVNDVTPIAIELQEDATQSGGTVKKWTGSAFITGVSVGTPSDGMVTYSYTFQGTGALVVPTS